MTNLENLKQYKQQLLHEMLKNAKRMVEYNASISNLPPALLSAAQEKIGVRSEEGLRLAEKLIEVSDRIDELEAEAVSTRSRRIAVSSNYSK